MVIWLFDSTIDAAPRIEEYVDAMETLERRLDSIDRTLTNDYIEECLFTRNKDMTIATAMEKTNPQKRKNIFKNLLRA